MKKTIFDSARLTKIGINFLKWGIVCTIGAISFRWYTAVSSEWVPKSEGDKSSYVFNRFICENGQKVVVEKGVTNYYVYDSRDGMQIKIEY